MENINNNNIYSKAELPPCGFILQKDVYTTNLLYANDQFPLKSLKKRLPFRPRSGKKMQNPSHSVIIIRERGNVHENDEKKNKYLSNIYKPKLLNNRKLKFPLPKIKTFPLTYLNLHEEISKKDVKIKNMDDDLNITSNNGRKIFYRFKENKLSNLQRPNFPPIVNKRLINMRLNLKYKHRKRSDNDKSRDRISLNNIVNQLNNELKNIRQIELERKRSFIKDKFFSTQIYVENILDLNNGDHKNNNTNNGDNNNNNNNSNINDGNNSNNINSNNNISNTNSPE